MALQKRYTVSVYSRDLIFDTAYVQITKVTGDKISVLIEVSIYDDANKQHIIEQKTYQFVPGASEQALRWDKQGYEYLKTQTEFADAIDV